MATIGKRGSTWSNPDGLVVGYGTNKASVEGSNAKNYPGIGGMKTKSISFTSKDLSGVKIPMPAGSKVYGVCLDVGTQFVGGTSLAFGISGTTDGFITPTQGATASLVAGAHINGSGSLLTAGTDTTAPELYLFSAAADAVLTVVGTFTAGSGTIAISYV